MLPKAWILHPEATESLQRPLGSQYKKWWCNTNRSELCLCIFHNAYLLVQSIQQHLVFYRYGESWIDLICLMLYILFFFFPCTFFFPWSWSSFSLFSFLPCLSSRKTFQIKLAVCYGSGYHKQLPLLLCLRIDVLPAYRMTKIKEAHSWFCFSQTNSSFISSIVWHQMLWLAWNLS